MKIAQKTMLLVAVPLLLEMAFVAGIALLVQQWESEFDREESSKRVLISMGQFEASLVTVFHSMIVSESDRVEATRIAQSAPAEISAATDAVVKDLESRQDAQEKVKDMRDAGARLIECAQDFARVFGDPSIGLSRGSKSLRQKFLPFLRDFAGVFRGIVADEKQIQDIAPKKLEQTQNWIVAIFAGALISLAVSVIAAVFVARDLARRLMNIGENARLITQGLPLPEQDVGSDEISGLDVVLHQSAQRLAEFRRKQMSYVVNAVDVICSLDEDGKFVRINPACIKFWLATPEELQGTSLASLLLPAEKEKLDNLLASAKAAPGAPKNATLSMSRPDGQLVHMRWSVKFNADTNQFYCVAHDMTEWIELQKFKRQVLSMISHDMRTPLTSASSGLSLIENGVRGPVPESALAHIRASDERITSTIDLIRQLLESDKLEAGNLEPSLGCVSALDAVVLASEMVAGARVQQPSRDAALKADADLLQQSIAQVLRLVSTKSEEIKCDVEQAGDAVEIVFDGVTLNDEESADIGMHFIKSAIRAQHGSLAVDESRQQIRLRLPQFAEEA